MTRAPYMPPQTGSVGRPRALRNVAAALSGLLLVASTSVPGGTALAQATGPGPAQAVAAERIQALVPRLEAYIESGMKDFDLPGLAIGIVAGDRLAYAKGFGVRSKNGAPVDTRTVFQIGSTTKAFLAATLAIMVDRGKLAWDDRIVDLDPEFQLKDPWVTREFRVFDLLAQRSGLPPYANDMLGMLGLNEAALIRSLRYVEPVSSFRTTFAYTNITHLLAGRIVAKAAGAPSGDAVLRQELLDPLDMKDSSYTAEAMMAAPNHAEGYRWAPDGTVEVPFTQLFPYDFGGAGDINSSIEDMARWVRLQLGNGSFEGRQIVSPQNLAYTHTPKVALTDKAFYALGWVVLQTPNGNIVWHNGGTSAFGAFVGLVPDRDVAVIVLSNETNVGLPDAIGLWTLDRLLGNPDVDHVAARLKSAKSGFEESTKQFAKPSNPSPFPAPAAFVGKFDNPGIGKLAVTLEGDALVAELQGTGARLELKPWDGGVFTAELMALGKFADMAENLGPGPQAFAQFQADKDGQPAVLRLTFSDGQAYDFTRD